jgi:hypothetical protein
MNNFGRRLIRRAGVRGVEAPRTLFCEDDEPEAMMQACLHIMVPGEYERTRDAVVQTG